LEPIAPPPAADARAPRSLGAVLDAAFDVVRREWMVLVGLSALLYIPASFVQAAVPEPGADATPIAPWIGLAALLAVVAVPIVVGGVTDACGDALRGRPTDAGQALRRGLGLALPLVGTWLVLLLVVLVAMLPLAGVVALWDSLGWLRVPAALLAVAIPFLLLVRLSLVTQVAVLERRFGPRALARANRLIEGHVVRVFGTLGVAGLLAGLLSGAAGLALGALPGVGPVATGLVQAVGFAYTTAVGVVVYDEVRARRGEDAPPSPPPSA
jgi:hypothetical protein